MVNIKIFFILGYIGLTLGQATIRPCGDEPKLDCVRTEIASLTGLRAITGLGDNVYEDLEPLVSSLPYENGTITSIQIISGLYKGEIFDFYTDGTNTYLSVTIETVPVYTEYTGTQFAFNKANFTFEGAGTYIFEGAYFTITFYGTEDLSLDNAGIYTGFRSTILDVVSFAEAAAVDEDVNLALQDVVANPLPLIREIASTYGKRIGRAYFLSQIATNEPVQTGGNLTISTVKNRKCNVTNFECIQSSFAEKNGLTAITETSTGNAYIVGETLTTELGAFNATSFAEDTYINIDEGVIVDFFNDGEVTVLAIEFEDLIISRNYTVDIYTINELPTTFSGSRSHTYSKITVTATFDGVDNISFGNFSAFSYVEGTVEEDFSDLDALAETSKIIANTLAAVKENITNFIQERAFYVAPKLVEAFVYTKLASEDGTSKAVEL